jgi:hypothetical protein
MLTLERFPLTPVKTACARNASGDRNQEQRCLGSPGSPAFHRAFSPTVSDEAIVKGLRTEQNHRRDGGRGSSIWEITVKGLPSSTREGKP